MSHDRTGDVIDDEPPAIPTHDPRCDGRGWVDRDGDPAIPCYDCKPNLRPAELRRALLDADKRRENP
ncbi:hypothetical protein [Amycolatopsis eburnea]|uniref:Uncharacterized protein n=1 Tax=Amycolatopsis eburnea TaxID=2267691 RepID=A0A427TFV5_9PSEU|nr:hypothetical protein [Amycolatopsis eburnea]RSD21981.1 hypothetical protein EIY87_09190 [Amycolatopsis eburnea]